MYWCWISPHFWIHQHFKIKQYPLETVISEKLETTISKSEFNSRRKDFYDLWLLSEGEEFDGEVLLQAIKATFQDRNTNLPADLSEIFSYDFVAQHRTAWSAFLKREELEDNAPGDFEEVVVTLRLFLLPLLTAIQQNKRFDMLWKSGGPWQVK